MTAIDYCLGMHRKRRKWSKHAFEEAKDEMNQMNLAMATVIFNEISEYSYMHGGDAIVDSVINAIKIDLPGIGEYLDNRMKEDLYFRSNSQKCILGNMEREGEEVIGNYAAINASCWARESDIQKQLYEDEGSTRPMDLIYLDIPMIHTYTEEGMDFFDALVENTNMELYARPSIQVLID